MPSQVVHLKHYRMVPSIATQDSRLLQAFSDPPSRSKRIRFIGKNQRLSLPTRERGEEANTSTENTKHGVPSNQGISAATQLLHRAARH